MKHATTRILFGYWDALRGERAAPDRSEIQPANMRHVLGDTFILANEGEPVFRLAGSRTCALFGRDLSRKPFRSLWQESDRAEAERLADTVLRETEGVVAGAIGLNANGSELPLELIVLPLRHGKRSDKRLLGALSPAIVPSWAGLVPLIELQIRSSRVIASRAHEGTTFRPPNLSERRGQLVLHDGGLA